MSAVAPKLFIDLSPPNEGAEPGARTLASAVYARLRVDILACRHQPGEKLLIAALAKGFGVSAVAVREALSRLVADGLVVAEDQRGFRVSKLSLADLIDVTHTRIELECLALRRSIDRADAAWRRNLEATWHELDAAPHLAPGAVDRHHEAWPRAHGRFHAALIANCGLDWLMRFRTVLYEQSERYRRLSLTVTRTDRDTRGEHRLIYEAAMRGDSEAASRELAAHFERTAQMIVAAYPDRGQSELLSSKQSERS
ncbi:MAG: GntR family transcriptional regulator [Alphaproteobacteria bacterium]|nr:GntR family transcriptional regulator [Alphaproteobacteria bacterium]